MWAYYRSYTHSAIHTATAAALTAFGLLIFIDPLFVVLAIAAYVCPPIVLYTLDADIGTDTEPSEVAAARVGSETQADSDSNTDLDSDGDSDSDSGDGDTDSDGADADANADR